jgi:hypothetical protein
LTRSLPNVSPIRLLFFFFFSSISRKTLS